MNPFLYFRALRYVEHTVFSVADGQKFYRDPIFGSRSAYSSGQQVKRSVLDSFTSQLNVPYAPITFNWTITKDKAEQGEAWSLCDPSYPDQLIGGYMKAEKNTGTVKRRSPLSISAMRPLHPLLGGLEDKGEAMSFDRSAYADRHKVNVFKVNEDKRELMTEEEVVAWLEDKSRTLPPKKWIEPQLRAGGLFVYDIAIDLRTLFCVSTNPYEPEVYPDTIESLKSQGWTEGENVFGYCLICPASERKKIIPALAHALLNWRITSNQSRTFSLMETLAIAVSDNANQVAYAIRAELDAESERPKAHPVIDETAKARIFLTPSVSGYIKGESGSPDALDDAVAYIKSQLAAYPYEAQMQR
ncbi:MAG: CRISPR-associated protein Cas7 [Bacteroidia bacterium]|nr:CRISPR-associated protein Cas7 [Bacteroidia bacterium]